MMGMSGGSASECFPTLYLLFTLFKHGFFWLYRSCSPFYSIFGNNELLRMLWPALHLMGLCLVVVVLIAVTVIHAPHS